MNRPKLWLSSINKKWRFYMSRHKGRRAWHLSLALSLFSPSFHSQNQFIPVTCHVVTHQSAPFSPREWKFNWDICAAQGESPTAAACGAREIHFACLTELLCCKRPRLLNLRLGNKTFDVWKHKFVLCPLSFFNSAQNACVIMYSSNFTVTDHKKRNIFYHSRRPCKAVSVLYQALGSVCSPVL